MKIINLYLEQLQNNSDLDRFLSGFHKVTKFTSKKDIINGLLNYNSIEKNECFLFVYPDEKILKFHTIGMKFSIGINFYNKDGKLIQSYINVVPGISNISSKGKSKYVIEWRYK